MKPPLNPPQTAHASRGHAALWPALALVLTLLLAWGVLLLRGLDFGFTGDLLDYAYHYERFGTFGGIHWLVTEHLHRHLFAGVFSAPLAYLFPNQAVPWFAYAFLSHFASAGMAYVLASAVLRGQRLWLAYITALLFAFHTLHTSLNFEFPTSGHGNSALFLSLLSLWLFLRYVRGGRRNRWWLDLSLAAYIFAIGTYEQTVLFFLLHPLIAWFEDRAAGVRLSPVRFLIRSVADSFWFPVFVVVYLYLLRVLFVGSSNLQLSPSWILGQLVAGVRAEVDPVDFVQRIQPTVLSPWLPLTGILALLLGAGLWGWSRRSEVRPPTLPERSGLLYLLALGVGISVVSILGVSPTNWYILDHPRMIYPSAVGFGMTLAALSALLIAAVPRSRLTVTMLLGLLIAMGAVRYLVVQSDYAAQAEARNRVLTAITTAIPAVSQDPLPYLLITTDAHPTTDLWLFAQDNRFPYTFDRLYGVVGMPVDVIYTSLDPALAPPDDQPGAEAHGQFIIVEPEGIYSPLRHGEPIDPARLVIVAYDSTSGTARVLDALPDEVRETGNIVERASIDWRTNDALIETATQP